MTDDRWIVIPNWAKYHERTDRSLPWMKVYYELAGRDDWRQLTLAARGLLVCIWIEYHRSKGQIRTSDIPARVAQKFPRKTLESLSDAGFLRIVTARPPELTTVLDKRREEPPKSPAARGTGNNARKPRVTGWRLVRGSHGQTTIADPNGTDPAPTIGRTL